MLSRSSHGPSGGPYVAWFESVASTSYQLRLQLLDVNGLPKFGAAGPLVSIQPQRSVPYRYAMQTDNQGNAVRAFRGVRSADGSNQCGLYKISPTGQPPWGLLAASCAMPSLPRASRLLSALFRAAMWR